MTLMTTMTDALGMADTPLGMLASYMLASPWKPLILVVTLLAWARIITSYYDKHAARFYLPRETWNVIHLSAAVLAVAVGFGLPWQSGLAILASWGGMALILAIDVVAYAMYANKDERVPEQHRVRVDFSAIQEAREKKAEAKEQRKVELAIQLPSGQTLRPPASDSPEFEIRAAAEKVYIDAQQARASRVDIGPTGKGEAYGVVHTVDGVRQGGATLPAAEAIRIIDFWKNASGLDIEDRRRRQSGMTSIERINIKQATRITTHGAQGGMRLTMVFDPSASVIKKVEDLGFLDRQLDTLKEIAANGTGVVLLAGQSMGGRTTTLYAMSTLHDAYTQNIMTLEADPTSELEGVKTNKFDAQAEGAEYATTLRSILRRDPDVVLVGEMPDAETAKEAARADQDRSRTYLSMKAEGALPAIQLWVKAVGDLQMAADSLSGVIAQRLARRLCTMCRAPYQPTPDMLKKLGLPADKAPQLYKKGGQVMIKNKPETCPQCGGVGYFGQIGLFEVYPIGPEERERIAAGDLQGLRALLRKRQLPSLQQVAVRRAAEGVTSVEEAMRVLGSSGGASKPAAKPAAQAAGAAAGE